MYNQYTKIYTRIFNLHVYAKSDAYKIYTRCQVAGPPSPGGPAAEYLVYIFYILVFTIFCYMLKLLACLAGTRRANI